MPAASPSRKDIRIPLVLKAPPERVYAALTAAAELSRWWLERADTDPRNMGRFRMVWPASAGCENREAGGVFVDLEPGGKVAWIWDEESMPKGLPRMVSFFIERKEKGCELTMVHAGFPAEEPESYEAWRKGWEDCLAKLKRHVEGGK